MPKKIPMRRCVVTHEQLPKNDMLRVVKTPEGELKIDLSGRMNGRGAYVKKDVEVVAKAKKSKALERALGINIPEEFYEEIERAVC